MAEEWELKLIRNPKFKELSPDRQKVVYQSAKEKFSTVSKEPSKTPYEQSLRAKGDAPFWQSFLPRSPFTPAYPAPTETQFSKYSPAQKGLTQFTYGLSDEIAGGLPEASMRAGGAIPQQFEQPSFMRGAGRMAGFFPGLVGKSTMGVGSYLGRKLIPMTRPGLRRAAAKGLVGAAQGAVMSTPSTISRLAEGDISGAGQMAAVGAGIGTVANQIIDPLVRTGIKYSRAYGRLSGPKALEFAGTLSDKVMAYDRSARNALSEGLKKVEGVVDFSPISRNVILNMRDTNFSEGLRVAMARQENRYGARILKDVLGNPSRAKSLTPSEAHEVIRTLESMPQVYGRVGTLEGKIGTAGTAGELIEEAQKILKQVPGVSNLYKSYSDSMRRLGVIAPKSDIPGQRELLGDPYGSVTAITRKGLYESPEARQIAAETLGKELASEAEALRRIGYSKRGAKKAAEHAGQYGATYGLLRRGL